MIKKGCLLYGNTQIIYFLFLVSIDSYERFIKRAYIDIKIVN